MMRNMQVFVGMLLVVMGYANVALADGGALVIPVNRAELVALKKDAAEVMVGNPDVADVHVHSPRRISILGKAFGTTNIRILDKDKNVINSFNAVVTYDLPAIRKALKEFLPNESIGIKLVNTNVALVGDVSSASVVDRALQIVNEFVKTQSGPTTTPAAGSAAGLAESSVLNLLQVNSGQQVMLRVRVGEIQRTALKKLGSSFSGARVNGGFSLLGSAGNLRFEDGLHTFGTQGLQLDSAAAAVGGFQYENADVSVSMALEALESQGLFKILAEPNLVALSGEKAEFLAGGEFPVPVVTGAGAGAAAGVEFKPYGVTVQFIPYVLSANRIRLVVEPEVSEISTDVTTAIGSTSVPALTTRRAKTTVELAPGESFMIAGLLRDQLTSSVRQLPGLGEVPVLGALLRSTSYQRKESELVIAVTPYLVDPLRNDDVRLPTDNFKPASMMDMMFYGALGAVEKGTQGAGMEGSVGFMVE